MIKKKLYSPAYIEIIPIKVNNVLNASSEDYGFWGEDDTFGTN